MHTWQSSGESCLHMACRKVIHAYGHIHVHIGSYEENMHTYMAGWRDVPAYGMQEGEP